MKKTEDIGVQCDFSRNNEALSLTEPREFGKFIKFSFFYSFVLFLALIHLMSDYSALTSIHGVKYLGERGRPYFEK